MFFEKTSDIAEIAGRAGCSIFVVPDDAEVKIKNAFILEPTTKTTITIDQVREVLGQLTVKQTRKQVVLIRPADKLGEEAESAILKNLEEPSDNIHFVLVTNKPSKLLPTILSRAALYILRKDKNSFLKINADEKVMTLAKQLIATKPADLPKLAEDLTSKKEGVRDYVLDILGIAIEISYKSYFKTGKQVFLAKIPKFITAYENIAKNGHIKLHLVADLI